MNKRLVKLIENQPIRGGQFLDCYNQAVSDIAGTIRTTIDHSNMFFYTEDMNEEITTKIAEPFVVARPHGYYAGGEYADVSPCCKSSAMADNNFVKERFRIRKLTPRECFRLMGCDEQTIDKIQASGVSRSQQYKLAGNSIVVDVLTAIFDKMFVHTEITELKLFY